MSPARCYNMQDVTHDTTHINSQDMVHTTSRNIYILPTDATETKLEIEHGDTAHCTTSAAIAA